MDEGAWEEGEDPLVTSSEYAIIYLVLSPIIVPYRSFAVLADGEELYDSASALNLVVTRWAAWGFLEGVVDNGGRRQGSHISGNIASTGTPSNDK